MGTAHLSDQTSHQVHPCPRSASLDPYFPEQNTQGYEETAVLAPSVQYAPTRSRIFHCNRNNLVDGSPLALHFESVCETGIQTQGTVGWHGVPAVAVQSSTPVRLGDIIENCNGNAVIMMDRRWRCISNLFARRGIQTQGTVGWHGVPAVAV
ncbi:hypothetical protein BJ912DRAFT_931461 [Pholiota molesta]|nr:hypothetical protein BJ912DRAFT_931461 [Pholiota molesta]